MLRPMVLNCQLHRVRQRGSTRNRWTLVEDAVKARLELLLGYYAPIWDRDDYGAITRQLRKPGRDSVKDILWLVVNDLGDRLSAFFSIDWFKVAARSEGSRCKPGSSKCQTEESEVMGGRKHDGELDGRAAGLHSS